MADRDDADPASAAKAPSPQFTTTPISTFASVNKPSAPIPPSVTSTSKIPPANTTRVNGVSAKPSAESQPMTATSSSSSHPPDQQNGNAAEANGASPYGTRSRNRNGVSRPNYAEDRDPDMDFEYTASKKALAAALPASMHANDIDKSSGSNTRRSSNTISTIPMANTKAVPSNASKDTLPGMSSFSVNPEMLTVISAPAPSRKRKAPGAGPANHAPSASAQLPITASSRRTTSGAMANSGRAANLMSFESCRGFLKNGKLRADDGTTLSIDDQVYLICEPPGEPYYLARVMEFLHVDNDRNQPVDSLRVNWYFRPRDIQRKVNDTRVVFASMQSDTCPIQSLRGKCQVLHRSEIENLDEYRKAKDSFWYEKMFDRYIHRYYEVIPTRQVINVPSKVKRVLDERWKYVVVEIGRGKDLTSAIKSCRRCVGYCASNDSVDCAVCKNTYHMNCVRPPLLKKPARGFGWSCGSCSRKQERRLEARNTTHGDGEEDEILEEEEEDHGAGSDQLKGKDADETLSSGPRPPTAEQLAQAKLWPYRYLGIHCRVEDALDYDDRIYPRASSRLGPKHQANVQAWHGHSVEYVKPTDIKKKYMKGSSHKKDAKMTKDTIVALEADKASREKRPKWMVDEPLGYIPRGEDLNNGDLKNTAQLKFRMPEVGERSLRGTDSSNHTMTLEAREKTIDEYMAKAKAIAQPLFNLRDFSTNFLDKALELLTTNDYQIEKALTELQKQKRRQDLKEPELTEEEIRRFEDGVARYGSELRNVSRHVGKSQKHGEIVRFYYMWKKTERGKRIWDNYEGRKGKKQAKQADARLLDDVADDDDDSAFDNAKAAQRKRGFECKFCTTRKSPQWRRAPATAPGTTIPSDSSTKTGKDKNSHLILALCQRCAGLWRKYGIQWENIDEVAKKVAQGGGRAWKRRIDEELLIELVSANQASSIGLSSTAAAAAASVGLEVPANVTHQAGSELPKKKLKMTNHDFAALPGQETELNDDSTRKKLPEKPPEPPLIPEQPQFRLYPCDVCNLGVKDDPTLVICRHCRLTVHPHCYGITSDRADKWMCDTCANDVNPQKSTIYECLLCSHYENEDKAVMEPPKQSHKKKTDREKEKDRLERELIAEATTLYYKQQEEKGRPTEPRQSLKPTTAMNWSHVICSIMHSGIKYTDAPHLQAAEGFTGVLQPAPKSKEARCKLCKILKGSLLFCEQCDAPVHASCAQRYGYTLGLSLKPVAKNSVVKSMTISDMTGTAEAKIFCREHGEKKNIYPLFMPATVDGEVMNALKAFAITNKSVSHGSLTGTARKAELVQAATKSAAVVQAGGNARGKPTINEVAAPSTRSSRVSPSTVTVQSEDMENGDRVVHLGNGKEVATDGIIKQCARCQIDVSPMWHKAGSRVAGSVASPLKEIRQPGTDLTIDGIAALQSKIRLDEVTPKAPTETVLGVDDTSNMVSEVRNGHTETPFIDESHVLHPIVEETKHQPQQDQESMKDDDHWLCHKCFVRKKKSPPTPSPAPTPEPEPIMEDVREPEPASPLTPVVWQPPAVVPSVPPPAPPPAPPQAPEQYIGWSAPPEPQQPAYPAPERLSNGISHSSPAPVSRPATHYVAPPHPPPPQQHPPPPPQHYPSQPYPYRDERAPTYRAGQPMQYVGHQQPSGYPHPVSEPPSFQYRRDPHSGQLVQIPYVPPLMRQQNQPHQAPVRSPSQPRRRRSPPVHMRSPSIPEQGPHGPPEADSNPFAVLNGSSSHASPPPPPPQYPSHMYGSPRVRQDRPETPTNAYDRDSRWPSEISMQNGASASPSVRNLLH